MNTKLLNNRYQIIEVLGAGGFGETFLAEDTYMPSRRRCVIKKLKPITGDPQTYDEVKQRFEREAATLEFLGEGSDKIPKLYAYFCEQGLFYLVQEWIEGSTLTEVIETKGRLPEAQVRNILLNLLSVLDYVHSKRIIHRDIKPDNVILSASNGKPVLIDFGAVKETVCTTVANCPGHFAESLIIGTPGYMPSEQAIGRPIYATDIYSLGLTAIFLLTGKTPQELKTDQETGEICWLEYASGVSPDLVQILNRAIRIQAGERFTTASKMLYALKSEAIISPGTIVTKAETVIQNNVAISPNLNRLNQSTRKLSSEPKTDVVGVSSPNSIFGSWQKKAVVIGSLLFGSLIAGAANSSFHRQPLSEKNFANSPLVEPRVSASPEVRLVDRQSPVNSSEPIQSPPSPPPTPKADNKSAPIPSSSVTPRSRTVTKSRPSSITTRPRTVTTPSVKTPPKSTPIPSVNKPEVSQASKAKESQKKSKTRQSPIPKTTVPESESTRFPVIFTPSQEEQKPPAPSSPKVIPPLPLPPLAKNQDPETANNNNRRVLDIPVRKLKERPQRRYKTKVRKVSRQEYKRKLRHISREKYREKYRYHLRHRNKQQHRGKYTEEYRKELRHRYREKYTEELRHRQR